MKKYCDQCIQLQHDHEGFFHCIVCNCVFAPKSHYENHKCHPDHERKLCTSGDTRKYDADIKTYTVKCHACHESFPGDSDYENHFCKDKLKDFEKNYIEKQDKQAFPGLMEIPVAKNFEIVYAKLDNLEKSVSDIESHLEAIEINKSIYNKKPHKCPVCEGSGNHPDQTPRLMAKEHTLTGLFCCVSCDGKGILWG